MEVFTTGDVARICKVAQRTVTNWTERGQLKFYRIPGSRDRRITRPELAKFITDNGLPAEFLPAEAKE
jgi:two-component system response regulator RpaA